jgi:hypothetical protein
MRVIQNFYMDGLKGRLVKCWLRNSEKLNQRAKF